MKVVAGSYERFLFGYDLKLAPAGAAADSAAGKGPRLLHKFTYAAHLGPVKSLAVSGHVAVSGGSDDIIKIYDLKAQTDMGTLMQHEGAVTCLEFYGPRGHPSHLLSGGEDSNVCVWDADMWQHLTTLKGHKAAVNDITVHPSGRLALSVSRDCTMRMWNLVQGRPAFRRKLPKVGELVKFSRGAGDAYAVGTQNLVAVCTSDEGVEIAKFEHGGKVLCLAFHSDNILVTAGEEGIVRIWDTKSSSCALSIPSPQLSGRIRGIQIPPSVGAGDSPGGLPAVLVSAASDGAIRVWDTRMIRGPGPKQLPSNQSAADPENRNGEGEADLSAGSVGKGGCILEVQTKARLTCLAVTMPVASKPMSRPVVGGERKVIVAEDSKPGSTKPTARKAKSEGVADEAPVSKSERKGKAPRAVVDVSYEKAEKKLKRRKLKEGRQAGLTPR